MKLVYTTYRYGREETITYHCQEFRHDESMITMGMVPSHPQFTPDHVVTPAAIVRFGVLTEDNYYLFDCAQDCPECAANKLSLADSEG